jgi:hypothetical protein
MPVIQYEVQPLQPIGDNYLRTADLIDLPVGDLPFTFPELDHTRHDQTVRTGIPLWMKEWCTCKGLRARNDGLLNIIEHLSGVAYRATNLHDLSVVVKMNRTGDLPAYDGCPMVFVEEKEEDSDATRELYRKCGRVSTLGRLPFVFGMAFSRTQLEVFAIPPDGRMSSLFHAFLYDEADR